MIPNGVHSLTNEQYHGSSGLSRSALMQFKKSPYHYWYEYLNPDRTQKERSSDMILGEVVHTLALEPEEASKRFAVAPSVDKRTKEGKALWAQFIESQIEQPGVQIISENEWEMAEAISQQVRDQGLVQSLLDKAHIEKSIYFTHESTGIQCKVRPDIWLNSLVGDLKTTKDASYSAFQRSAISYGYFLQAGMIYEALLAQDLLLDKFIFIAVEKTPPYAVGLFTLDEEAIDLGRQQFHHLMDQFAVCQNTQAWHEIQLQTLQAPGYAYYD